MAIQQRRGAYADFKPNKMTPAEIAVVQSGDPVGVNGQAVYVAFQAGTVKRLATNEDIQAEITSATSEIAADLVSEIESDISEDVTAAQTAATSASNSAETATQAVSTIGNQISSAFVEKTASGAVATFPDGADAIPVKSVIAHIKPVQSGSGDPSPSNVRPISGWTGVNVTRAGKNLLPQQFSGTLNGVTYTTGSDGSVVANGTASSTSNKTVTVHLYEGDYALSGSPSGGGGSSYQMWVANSSGQAVGLEDTGNGGTAHLAEGNYQVRIRIASGYTANNVKFYPMLRFVNQTDSTYEPYSGTIYPITFPQSAGTVYGGYVDVTNGKLVVDRKLVQLNGSETLSMLSGYRFVVDVADNIVGEIVSDKFKSVSAADISLETEYVIAVRSQTQIVFRINSTTSGTVTAKDWLTENTPYIAYKVQTPVIYDLTPTEITSLLGYNAVWSDTGDTDVVYRADVGMALDGKTNLIESIITDVETSATATKNYSVSSYLIYNNVLYKVTSAITSGETITPGTNVTATTIMQELLALA